MLAEQPFDVELRPNDRAPKSALVWKQARKDRLPILVANCPDPEWARQICFALNEKWRRSQERMDKFLKKVGA